MRLCMSGMTVWLIVGLGVLVVPSCGAADEAACDLPLGILCVCASFNGIEHGVETDVELWRDVPCLEVENKGYRCCMLRR